MKKSIIIIVLVFIGLLLSFSFSFSHIQGNDSFSSNISKNDFLSTDFPATNLEIWKVSYTQNILPLPIDISQTPKGVDVFRRKNITIPDSPSGVPRNNFIYIKDVNFVHFNRYDHVGLVFWNYSLPYRIESTLLSYLVYINNTLITPEQVYAYPITFSINLSKYLNTYGELINFTVLYQVRFKTDIHFANWGTTQVLDVITGKLTEVKNYYELDIQNFQDLYEDVIFNGTWFLPDSRLSPIPTNFEFIPRPEYGTYDRVWGIVLNYFTFPAEIQLLTVGGDWSHHSDRWLGSNERERVYFINYTSSYNIPLVSIIVRDRQMYSADVTYPNFNYYLPLTSVEKLSLHRRWAFFSPNQIISLPIKYRTTAELSLEFKGNDWLGNTMSLSGVQVKVTYNGTNEVLAEEVTTSPLVLTDLPWGTFVVDWVSTTYDISGSDVITLRRNSAEVKKITSSYQEPWYIGLFDFSEWYSWLVIVLAVAIPVVITLVVYRGRIFKRKSSKRRKTFKN